jgi:hypothetical protein
VPDTREGKVSQVDVRNDRVVRTVRIGDAAAFYQRECAAYGSIHSFMVTTFHVRDCDLPSALAATPQATWAALEHRRRCGCGLGHLLSR